MATINSLGLGSGILTSDLLDKIIKAERDVSDLRFKTRSDKVEAKISAFGQIRSMVSDMQTAMNSLASPSFVRSSVVTSSDDTIVTASSSGLLKPVSTTLEVNSLAKSHALVSGSYSTAFDAVGTGSLTFSFGEIAYNNDGSVASQQAGSTGTFKLDITSSNNTLTGIRDAINAADKGVRANIINDGSGFRLQLVSAKTGKAQAMTITARDDNGAIATSGLSKLAYGVGHSTPGGTSHLTQSEKASDAVLSLNGLRVTRSENTIDDVINGVTLSLQSANVGKAVTISVKPDSEKMIKKIESFVEAYNKFKEYTDQASAYDKNSKQLGLLSGDSTVRAISDKVRGMLSQKIEGLDNKRYRSFADLGIKTDRNDGFKLVFDTSEFKKALAKDPSGLAGLMAKSGTAADSRIEYVNGSILTKPGKYDIEVTQVATVAKYQGASIAGLNFANPVVIDDDNNDFTINVNGTNINASIDKGSYATGDDLAAAIARAVNSTELAQSKKASVAVSFDAANNRFNIDSMKYGSDSRISLTSVDNNMGNTLGLNVLNKGTYVGTSLASLNASSFAGRSSNTLQGNGAVSQTGVDFSLNNATFDITVNGTTKSVTVSEKAFGKDLNGDGVFGDQKDNLQAVQNALNAANVNATASLNDNGYLVFSTNAIGASQSIEISNVGTTSGDTALGLNGTQGAQTNGKDVGLTLTSAVEFTVSLNGTDSATKVSIPAGTYATGQALAAELQTQIAAKISGTEFDGERAGARSSVGTRDISNGIDFSAAKAGFVVNVNGVSKEITVNANAADATAVAAQVTAQLSGSGIRAVVDGTGLKLETLAGGRNQSLQVTSDGRGAQASVNLGLASGIDFSAAPLDVSMTVGGDTLAFQVNANATNGSNDSASNLQAIQTALDTALDNSPNFKAGDVVAKLDSNNKLVFETVSKKGARTSDTFGANASIAVTATQSGAAVSVTADNGYDAFGFDQTKRFGKDTDVNVGYVYDNQSDKGRFEFVVGGQKSTLRFKGLDAEALTLFGMQEGNAYSESVAKGKDVAGKINGIEAVGKGQYLRAENGNISAKNGYYLSSSKIDFSVSGGITISAPDNEFKIKIDDTEVTLTLATKTYTSGADFAKDLQKAIDTNAELKRKKLKAKVEFSNDDKSFAYQKLSIISGSSGKESQVSITSAPAVLSLATGVGGGEKGKDAIGEPDDAAGVRVIIRGGEVGKRGSVTYVSGFADQLKTIFKNTLVGDKSTLKVKEKALEQEKTDIKEDKERLSVQLAAREARLRAKFIFNDSLIQKLNSTLDFVKQQFSAINGTKNK